MATKPILFCTDMVRAILDGRKTQERRVIIPQPENDVDRDSDGNYAEIFGGGVVLLKPRYRPGDILWVRETWGTAYTHGDKGDPGKVGMYVYLADGDTLAPTLSMKWRPSIYMPRTAARIFLRVTDVRVERLQEISEADAIAEGVTWEQAMESGSEHFVPTYYNPDNSNPIPDYIAGYERLWDSTLPKPTNKFKKNTNSWTDNPWVWVYTFERVDESEVERR